MKRNRMKKEEREEIEKGENERRKKEMIENRENERKGKSKEWE